MACALYVLDCGIARQYFGTCGEYWASVRRPFRIVPFFELWRCEQRNWADAYKEWSVLQLYFGVLVALSAGVATYKQALEEETEVLVVPIVVDVLYRAAMAYIMAHLSWFSVVKRHGCFCCFVACCQCPPLLLLWGLLGIAYGVLGFTEALLVFGVFGWASIVLAVLHGFYAIVLFHMGLCCLKLWLLYGTAAASASEAQVVGAPTAEPKLPGDEAPAAAAEAPADGKAPGDEAAAGAPEDEAEAEAVPEGRSPVTTV